MNLRACFVVLTAIMALGLFPGCGSSGNGIDCVQASSAGLTLKWDPPTTYEDGSPLTDLEGYKIYYGSADNDLVESVDVGPNMSYTITPSSQGKWYFAVTAYNLSGTESRYSNILCVDAM